MKTVELNRMGLMPITDFEMIEINGGGKIGKFFKGLTWYTVLTDAKDHWEEIKKGFSNGWNIDKPKK
jgi:hypothetical protein